jgi:steroid delta-isomerase-like uncharacterized protein
MPRMALMLLMMTVVFVGATTVAGQSPAFDLRRDAQAQEATPAASPAAVPDFLQRVVESLRAGDGAALAALYTEDGIYEDIQSGTVLHGREEIAAFITQSDANFKDVELRPVRVYEGDGWVADEYVYTATEAKSGARLEIRGATFYELEDGLIRHSTDYYALPTAKQPA